MDVKVPRALAQGAVIAVCSPSRSIGIKTLGDVRQAAARLQSAGFTIRLSESCVLPDRFQSSPAQERASELMAALQDPEVEGILISTGGWSAIDILPLIDFDELTAVAPKVICGMSDATVITTAVLAKLGWQTYYGPNFISFAEGPLPEWTMRDYVEILTSEPTAWRHLMTPPEYGEVKSGFGAAKDVEPDDGPLVVRPGVAEGFVFGGNLGTLFLLQGTEYWPPLQAPVVLFVEDDDLAGKYTLVEAVRRLRSLLLQDGIRDKVAGLVFGRFQKGAEVSSPDLAAALLAIPELAHVPIVANASFGHTLPMQTIPIGGRCSIQAPDVAIGAVARVQISRAPTSPVTP